MKKTSWFKGLLAACGLWAAAAWAAPMPVVASFSILGDVAREVGGSRVSVQTLVGPDQDGHVYQMSPADIRKLRAARLGLLSGLGFEGAGMQRAFASSHIPVAVASQGIIPTRMTDEHGHAVFDPHVWNDPVLMQTYARNVAAALMRTDPAGRAYYAQRLTAYEGQLRALDQWVRQQFAPIPVAQRKVLTGHDAFGYFARRYQLRFIAPQGVSTESEASARTVAMIVQQVRREHIKAVFVENIKDPRLVQQLGREAGVQVQGELYSDALSRAGGPAPTYLQLVRHNVQLLARAMR